MKIPFSMSDEPDLGDEFKVHEFHTVDLDGPDPEWLEHRPLYSKMFVDKLIAQHQRALNQYRTELLIAYAENEKLRMEIIKHDICTD